MRNVEIAVHVIAKSQVDDAAVRQWLDGVGAVSYQWPQPEQEVTSAEAVVGLAAKRCYMAFSPEDGLNPNVTKVRKDWTEYFNNILASGHGSVLEHATYTFAIEGVSRVFTAEMNRHRAGVAISEGSMRYIRFNDIPWWLPTSLRLTAEELEWAKNHPFVGHKGDMKTIRIEFGDETWAYFLGELKSTLPPQDLPVANLIRKKLKSQEIFRDVFSYCEKRYTELVDLWELDTDKTLPFHVKKVVTSCLRRIIPLGVASGAVYTLNLRALRHIMALRTSAAAEEEIVLVFSMIAKKMVELEPRLLGDFEQTPEGAWIPKFPKV